MPLAVVPRGLQQPAEHPGERGDKTRPQDQRGGGPHGAALPGSVEKVLRALLGNFIPAYSGFRANPVAVTGLTAKQRRTADPSEAGSELHCTIMV